MRLNRYPEALAALDAAKRLAPDSKSVRFMRGQVLMRLGRREEAQAEIAAAQRLVDTSLGKAREKLEGPELPNPELTRKPE